MASESKSPMASRRNKLPTFQLAPKGRRQPNRPEKSDINRLQAEGPLIPEDIATDGESYLHSTSKAPKFSDTEEEKLIDWFATRMVTFNKANRKQHYETIAQSYAMYAASLNDLALQRAVVESALRQGITITRKKSRLRIIVELHVSYGGEDDPQSAKQAASNYSRDVMAITNLIKRGVPPSKVVELSQAKGEGLNIWIRWFSNSNTRKNPSLPQLYKGKNRHSPSNRNLSPFFRDDSHLEDHEAVSHYLIWQCRRRDGAIVHEEDISIDEVNVQKINEIFKFDGKFPPKG